jgi:hypothetical protein
MENKETRETETKEETEFRETNVKNGVLRRQGVPRRTILKKSP